jgi:hypothetical protein
MTVTSDHIAGFSMDLPDWAQMIVTDREIRRGDGRKIPLAVEVPVGRPSNVEIERKITNFKLVADALELLLAVWPEIPGASVTLTPAHQDELKRIILALPASVAL